MAQNQVNVACAASEWTQITNADVTAITFQVRGPAVEIRFTTDATTPSASDAGYIYGPGEGPVMKEMADVTTLSGAARVWARPCGADSKVFVDHA